MRLVFRNTRKTVPDRVLYPYPMPNLFGLVLDPKEKATVKRVLRGSSGEKDGFKAGDAIVSLEGQPLLSIADFQWVLHHAPDEGALRAKVARDGATVAVGLTLNKGWRQRGDISWRATSWDLRRMVTGGLVLEDLPDAERRKAGLPLDTLALRVKYVGQYGEHAVGKNAGFQQGDVVTEVDGRTERMAESQLMAYLVNEKPTGTHTEWTVRRGREQKTLKLRMQ
jgi:S1-C subfamily serine protease